jgi:hypothetical protein
MTETIFPWRPAMDPCPTLEGIVVAIAHESALDAEGANPPSPLAAAWSWLRPASVWNGLLVCLGVTALARTERSGVERIAH